MFSELICNNNARKFLFACRRIDACSNLPVTVVNALSLSSFKNLLKSCCFDRFVTIGCVFVYSNLTFHYHIDKIIARAFVRSNLILKCFVSRDISALMRAFTVYVRPILEYASCVWSPYQMGQIKQIESVHRSFARRLLYHTSIDYKTRLLRLGVLA